MLCRTRLMRWLSRIWFFEEMGSKEMRTAPPNLPKGRDTSKEMGSKEVRSK